MKYAYNVCNSAVWADNLRCASVSSVSYSCSVGMCGLLTVY